jgi:glucans biosynthesis protein
MNDNVVAYWQPREPIPAGESADFSYRLRFTTEPLDDSLARAVSTRVGRSLDNEGQRSFVIDFESAAPVPEDLVLEVSGSAGEIVASRGHVVPETGAYRASFELDPKREDIVELRVELHSGSGHDPWSETWLYRWSR